MTDEAWAKLIKRAAETRCKAEELRKRAEAEYERRYGNNPSDVDDDWWIDTIEGGGGVDLASIKQQAELTKRRRDEYKAMIREKPECHPSLHVWGKDNCSICGLSKASFVLD